MRKVFAVDTKTIAALDRQAIFKVGIPSVVLMENAGRAVSLVILRSLRKIRHPKISVFCGLGNNAGDGFVIARHLQNRDFAVKTFLLGNPRRLKTDAAFNYQILKDFGGSLKILKHVDADLRKELQKSDLIVDAIFGIGLNRAVSGIFKDAIDAINKSGKPVVAVDIPSGLDGTTGKIYGACIKAKKTVTFTFMKKGFFRNEGLRHVGKIIVADIGIPKRLIKGM